MEKCTKSIYNCAPFKINLSVDVKFDVCMKVFCFSALLLFAGECISTLEIGLSHGKF